LREKSLARPNDLMEEEKKDDGIGYPFKMFLKEALTQ
jgi:hypothetical protein